jgi:hypothetical protein
VIAPTTERYLRLGLQLGRHDDGVVDAYFGPAELAAEVEAAAPVEPRALVATAEALLDDLDDGWLRDQVVGLRTYARVLAGDALPYSDEVEGCYGIRPAHVDGGAGEAETLAYLRRWGLMAPDLGTHVIRFLTEPTSRTYVTNYAAGMDLCAGFVAGDRDRFRRLLTEQIRVRDLVAASRMGDVLT